MKTSRWSARIALATACLAAACGSHTEAPAKTAAVDAPDIILVSIDSLRYDHLGCYGYKKPTSPTIDRVASEGVRCESAVSTTSWTLPAHAAMFTGLFDSTHGLVDNGLRLSDAAGRVARERLPDRGLLRRSVSASGIRVRSRVPAL
jgi:hypothetical protein